MDQPNFFGDYDTLLELVRNRVSVRRLKPDPIPDEYVNKILEIGRWAMSGANGQPWEFVVVKDAKIKKELYRVYIEENTDFIYWMEQQRDFKLRHPAYQMTNEESVQKQRVSQGWSQAPVLIVILGDGRRQWATVQGAHTFGRDQSHLTDGLANTSMMMHLAAAAGTPVVAIFGPTREWETAPLTRGARVAGVALGATDRLVDTFDQHRAVGQPRHRVLQGRGGQIGP